MELFGSTSFVPVWLPVVMAIAAFAVLLRVFMALESTKKPTVEDLFERACEVARTSWVAHSSQPSLENGLFIILKKDNFPYLKEDLDISKKHPDYSDFKLIQKGDYVALVSVRNIENNMDPSNISTFLRYARHTRVA